MLSSEQIKREAEALGLRLLGIVPPQLPISAVPRLQRWLEEGSQAGMSWMEHPRRLDPQLLFPPIQSVAVFWISYMRHAPPKPPGWRGRVARYAWGRDYHNILKKALKKLRRRLSTLEPELKIFLTVDTAPIMEKALAQLAGPAWQGHSTLLIHPELGSFGVLGLMLLDQPLASVPSEPGRCGSCQSCLEICPTGALNGGSLDSRRCLSYWSIEHRGLIPQKIRPLMKDWVFGCDLCQEICPWNHHTPEGDVTVWRPQPEHIWPDLLEWLRSPSKALEQKLLGSPLRRSTGVGLRRNALIVLANMRAYGTLPELLSLLEEDPSPVIRATALWSAWSLGVPKALKMSRADLDPLVQGERAEIIAQLDERSQLQ